MTKFQWDLAKYPIKQSLKNISDIIAKVSHSIYYKHLRDVNLVYCYTHLSVLMLLTDTKFNRFITLLCRGGEMMKL